jgi:hypothetical protein
MFVEIFLKTAKFAALPPSGGFPNMLATAPLLRRFIKTVRKRVLASSCVSVSTEQLASHWEDFMKFNI